MFELRCILLLAMATPMVVADPLPDEVVRRVAAQIDRQLVADIQAAGKVPEAVLDDGAFVRRAYLAIVGRIPSVQEAMAFIGDQSVSKREQLVDNLVASPGFDSHLFNWCGDLLRLQTRGDQHGLGWHVWLRQSLADNMPWDQLVSRMLEANGHAVENPAVGYYLRDRDMQLDNFSNTMQVFLGRQIGCAQCHDHPFDDWSQYDYYQMAAFTGGTKYRSDEIEQVMRRVVREIHDRQSGDDTGARADKHPGGWRDMREQARQTRRDLQPLLGRIGRNAIADDDSAMLRLPKDYKYTDAKPGEVVEPATLFGPKLGDVPAGERKQAFARWLTSPDNPYFTTTIVNRMWERTFGYPLLDSLDNLGGKSRTAHPKVLSQLEHAMKQCNYDLRQFSRILYQTKVFQRACMREEPAPGEPLVFSGMVLRRMSAEQLYDSFLVLRHGVVEDQPSNQLGSAWQGYVGMVKSVFGSSSSDLMDLAESAKQGQERVIKARNEFQQARTALEQAGNGDERVAAQKAFHDARDKFNEARESANPMMSMMGIDGPRDRDKDLRRASELPAPQPLGHMIREFGGSDRETPSSGQTDASVPQALALLNDWKTHVLGGRSNRLREQLEKLDTADARLDWLFLTLYGHPPDRLEKQRYLPLAKDTHSMRDLATAMVNSKRFIFIH